MAQEADVFLDEIESRFEIGQKIEQLIADRGQRPSQPAGELSKSDVKLAAIGRIDHAEHGLGLREIDSPGKKCPQREFTRLGKPRPAAQIRRKSASKSGGEPSVCSSATGWRV